MKEQAYIRWGTKKAIVAEYGEHYASVQGRWLVVGETAEGDEITPEGFSLKKSARADAHECAKQFGGIVVFVG